MNKKAALQLGINTIVVLVIAMVLIAGGITFIRTFLDNANNVLDPYFNPEDYPHQASAGDTVVFAQTSKLSIKSGDEITVPIGLYNKLGDGRSFDIKFSSCASGVAKYASISPHPVPITIVGEVELQRGEPTVKKIFVQAIDKYYTDGDDGRVKDLEEGNYLCTLKINTSDVNGYEQVLGQKDAEIQIVS